MTDNLISFNFKTLKIEFINKIMIIVFNRPEKLNAVNDEMKREQLTLLDLVINNREDIDVLIFTGAGKAFTSGADINNWKTTITGEKPLFSEWPSLFALKMSKIYIPVICAINGPAIGFGFNLLLWADYVIATPETNFIWPPFTKRGITTEWGVAS